MNDTASFPRFRMVHGVKVEKLPIGRWIPFMEMCESLPATILVSAFPDLTLGEIAVKLKSITPQDLTHYLSLILRQAPVSLLSSLGELLGIDREVWWNQLSPTEFLDILLAFWELNDLSHFFEIARSLGSGFPTGSKIGSPPPSPSG